MQAVGTQESMPTLDEVQPHSVSLKPWVALQSPGACMFSQYLCSMGTPDSAYIVHEVRISDRYGEMHPVGTPIDRGTPSIFMSPKLR